MKGRPALIVCFLPMFGSAVFAGSAATVSISKGELWVQQGDKGKRILSKTGGEIDGFELSPSKRFVSAHKIIGKTVDPDDTLPEDKQLMAPTYSVLVFDLSNGQMIKEITAPEGLLHLGNWVECETESYRFTTGSMLDVAGKYEYNPQSNEIKRFELDDLTECP